MSFKYELINEKEVKIVKYLGKEENLIIPSFTFINDKIYKITRIEKYSLNNENIKRLFIPKTIKKIHLYAFMGFKDFNIEEFIVDEKNSAYSSYDGNLYNKDKTILLRYASSSKKEEFIMPQSVEVIEDSSFDRAIYLKKVICSNSLKSIKSYAFASCTSLNKIDLPNSLLEINDYAFFNHESLEEIKLPANLEKLGDGVFFSIRKPNINISVSRNNKKFKVYNGALYSFDKTILYRYLSGNDVVKLYSSLKEIKSYAFSYLYLNEVNLPNSLINIGEYAFMGSTILKINIPDLITKINKSTFSYCSFLSSISLKNVEYIENNAFYNCKKLEDVEISTNIKYIGEGAFSLTKVNKLNYSKKNEEKKEMKL